VSYYKTLTKNSLMNWLPKYAESEARSEMVGGLLVIEILRHENLEIGIFLKFGAPKSGDRDSAARKLSDRNFAEPRFGDLNSGTRAIFYNFFSSNSFDFQIEQLKFEFSTGIAFALIEFTI